MESNVSLEDDGARTKGRKYKREARKAEFILWNVMMAKWMAAWKWSDAEKEKEINRERGKDERDESEKQG